VISEIKKVEKLYFETHRVLGLKMRLFYCKKLLSIYEFGCPKKQLLPPNIAE
jgi:hypothetical protein